MAMTEHNSEGRPLKPKTLPCKYCTKRFRRVEHVQRHERTHTKEKPFGCNWVRCGKTFGRRDLLVRHEKLVHLSDGNRDDGRVRKSASGSDKVNPSDDHGELEATGSQHIPSLRYPKPEQSPRTMSTNPTLASFPPPSMSDPHLAARNLASCNLDLLSDAATRLASTTETPSVLAMVSDMPPSATGSIITSSKAYNDPSPPYSDRGREATGPGSHEGLPPAYSGQPPAASFDDYHLFLDDFPASSHFLPSAMEGDLSFGLWPRPAAELSRGKMPGSSFSSSQFSPVQADVRDVNAESGIPRSQNDGAMRAPAWRISVADHIVIKNRLEEFSSGYINGFHEHLPFLHLPTLSPADLSLELIFAILAVGAQYRFEDHRGNALWYAAKAIALEQIRRRHSHEVHSLLPTLSAYSPHSARPSPSIGYRHSFNAVQNDRPLTQDTHREPYSPNNPQARLETIQALLLLFSVGLWGPKAILHEALSLQSQLALLVREEGLESETAAQATDWDTWIRLEGSTRTKLVAFCFFNLCSVVYNMPPLLLTSEANLVLPQPSHLWRMETALQWQEARQAYPSIEMSLQDAFSRVLNRSAQMPLANVSSLGNYVLIHAFLQHIYLLKHTSLRGASHFGIHRGLRVDDVEEVAHGLRLWQISFEQHRQIRAAESGHPYPHHHQQASGSDSSLSTMSGDKYPGGPMAFNATVLLRLAYIRLYTDINPSRRLETRDHILIAKAFHDEPLLVRSPWTTRAVVQAMHALAMLVKTGVNYVAHTKSFGWSMQLSLCNLECALLLSKWLITLSSIGPDDPPIMMEEKTLLENVRQLLGETEFAVPIDPSLAAASGPDTGGSASGPSSMQTHRQQTSLPSNDGAKPRQLAGAVIRLWAETFKGTHIFEMIGLMGQGLESYAGILEKTGGRMSMTRIPTT